MNSENARPYRSRLIRPCDACRKRRIACVRSKADEDCSLCIHRGQSCTFEDAPQARGQRRRRGPMPPRARPEVLRGEENAGSSNSRTSIAINNGTVFPNRTCFYSGSSSDQHPHLLRHLVYDDMGCFGDDLWTVWRVSNQESTPSYLTVYPNSHLDYHAQMYSLEHVDSIFSSHEDELIRLYYAYVHPSYPILGLQEDFQSKRAEKKIPSSLLAVVYNLGAQFWHFSPLSSNHECPLQQEIRPWIFSCLTLEARTPNLAVVQAFLLFMQMIPQQIRPPNHPGFWPMTNMLVGLSQDIGLHVDPTHWNISLAERKLRRVLWWAVFIHDKWMSHALGRPSHISSQSWTVKPLSLNDFSDDTGRLPVEAISSANAFISLCSLTCILADISDELYSIHSRFETLAAAEILRIARAFLSRVHNWKIENPSSMTEGVSHHYTNNLAGLSVCLSVQRAAFGALMSQDDASASSMADEIAAAVRYGLFPLLDSIESSQADGLWLSYIRGNLTMIGSLLTTLILSSVGDEDLEDRRALLIEYRSYLKRLTELHVHEGYFEFARLPLRRLSLIMEQLFGEEELHSSFGLTPMSVEEMSSNYVLGEEAGIIGLTSGQ